MKYSTTLLVLISCFLVFALALTKPSIAADLNVDASEPALDTDGDELRAGTEYYILPLIWPGGGGLTMARTGDQLCPLDVVQSDQLPWPSEFSNGLPLTFTPVNPKKGVIRVSTDLNIKFNASSTCVQPNVWRIQKSSNSEIQWSISTDGVEGNPGCDTVTNWFKIEKATTIGYKLVFCPTVCDARVLCRDIGIYLNTNGQRILSLSDKLYPFLVVFKKVSPLSSVV